MTVLERCRCGWKYVIKLEFGANLDFQPEVIHSIMNMFEVQEKCIINYMVVPMPEKQF